MGHSRVALVTGVGRAEGIGAGIARQLAKSGWDIAFTYWTPYDARVHAGAEPGTSAAIAAEIAGHGRGSRRRGGPGRSRHARPDLRRS